MSKEMAISRILKAYQAKGSSMMEAGAGAAWMFQSPTFQADINKAIAAWTQEDDPEPMKGVVMAMQTFGLFTQAEAEDILQGIEEV